MNFRDLLSVIGDMKDLPNPTWMIAARARRPIREISKDLGRLNKMGFVDKERVKRPCYSKRGRLCHKGFAYNWRISKQGKSYLNWMKNVRPLEDLVYLQLMNDISANVPEDVRDRLLSLFALRASYRYKGPTRQLRILDNAALPTTILMSERTKLLKENFELVKQNLALEAKNHEVQQNNDLIHLIYNVLSQHIASLRRELDEANKKSITTQVDLSREMRSMMDTYESMRDIYTYIMDGERDTVHYLSKMLYISSGEEKFRKAMEVVSRREAPRRAKLAQMINDVQRKIANLKNPNHRSIVYEARSEDSRSALSAAR